MKKFDVEFSELIQYETYTVEAGNADAAMDIFLVALEEGKVGVKDVDTAHYAVRDLDGTEEMSMDTEEKQAR